MTNELDAAYAECLQVARSHYENFPVASWLVPAQLRKHVAAIYNFARRADDFADEGDDPAEAKLAALAAMGQSLDACLQTQDNDDYLFSLIPFANTSLSHSCFMICSAPSARMLPGNATRTLPRCSTTAGVPRIPWAG